TATYARVCFPLRTVAFRGHFPKDMPFNYRKWNILAFRGRLMSLLVLTHSGVSPRPHLPQDKEGYGSDTSHAEKAGFFFKESRIFHLLGQIIIIVYNVFLFLESIP